MTPLSFLSNLFGKKPAEDAIGEHLQHTIRALQHQLRGLDFELFCKDALAIGYVHGAAQGAAKAAGTTDAAQMLSAVQVTFQTLFGERPGILLWAASNQWASKSRDERIDWSLGFEHGDADTQRFFFKMRESGQATFPNRLAEHVEYLRSRG